jgi:hypothetical protein
MAYTNIIFDDITWIVDFKVPLQVAFDIYLDNFERIEFEFGDWSQISGNAPTVTPGVSQGTPLKKSHLEIMEWEWVQKMEVRTNYHHTFMRR